MADRLRVFLIGVRSDDLDTLAASVDRAGVFDVVGRALIGAVQSGRVSIPPNADAVLSSPRAIAAGANADTEPAADLVEQLTPREREVLALVADGLPNREIARELEISEHTVKFHLASVFGKLGAASRTEAVRRGLELGLIEI